MASAPKSSADAAREAPQAAPRTSAPALTPMAAGPEALRERLGNRGFGQLMRRAPAPPPDAGGPFAGSAPIRIARADDPLERAAGRAVDAPNGDLRRAAHRPGPLAPLEPEVAAVLREITGRGDPLDLALRREAERRLGAALPDVRLFRGSPAPAAVGARAFAYGSGVFLAPEAPAPATAAGRELLLHELAHVDQQRRAGEAFIQREPPKRTTDGDWEVYTYAEGYTLRLNAKARKAEVLVAGKRWIQMAAPPTAPMPSVSFTLAAAEGVKVTQGVRVEIKTEADITIDVDQDIEDSVFSRLKGDRAEILYTFTGGGKATFTSTFEEPFAPGGMLFWGEDGKVVKQQMERIREFALPMTMRVTEERHVWINSDVQYANKRYEQITADKLPNSFPTFDTLEGLKRFLESAPKHDFLVLKMPDGKYVARAVTEEQMWALTQSIREGRTDLGWLPKLAHYNGKAATGQFFTFWLHGKEYASPDAIRDLFYKYQAFAEVGSGGAAPECEVYRMGRESYGRRPLTHMEAVGLLRSFDKMSKAEVFKREVEGFPFVSLRVKGKAKAHNIDGRYFDGREVFRTWAPKLSALGLIPSSADAMPIYQALDNVDVDHFLDIELDREQDNPEFIALLGGSKRVQHLVAQLVWRRITDRANSIATGIIEKGIEQLKPFAEKRDLIVGVIATFHGLTDKRKNDTLDFLGVEQPQRDHYKEVLSDPVQAARVARGESIIHTIGGMIPTIGGVGGSPPTILTASIDDLQARVKKQVEELTKLVAALGTRAGGDYEFSAILAEGEFGEHVRTVTYRELGIGLDPKAFPHNNLSPGRFPDPLSGDRSKFGSTFEQIVANQLNSHDSWATAKLFAKVTAIAIAAAILILFAHILASGIVTLLGLEGVLAFIVYTGLNAAVLTGGEILQAKLLEGRNPTIKDTLLSFAKNVVMVGAFTKFGRMLAGMSALARAGVMGATFLGISLTERLAEGGFRNRREFFLWLYENILMFALLEAGGQLIRPIDVRIQFWGRARRLGILVKEIDLLVGDIGKLQNKLTDLMSTPHRARLEAPKLQGEVKRLLELQRDLAQQVAQKVKDSNDPEAKFVAEELKAELKAVDEALAAMEEAGFLGALQISPVGESPNAFEYKPIADAVERIKKFFPKDTKVEASAEGVIRVTLPGQSQPFVLYPEGHPMLPVPRTGPIETKLNLNDATAEEIAKAEIPGVGKATAEKIVEQRKKRGGLFDSVEQLGEVSGIGPKTLEKIKASGKVEVAPKSKPNVIAVQQELGGRIQDVVERARRLGIIDKAVEALKRKQIGSFEEDLKKDRAEIEKVEKDLEARIKRAGLKARRRYEKRKSTPKDWLTQVKVERLANVSDEVVNEALTQIPKGLRNLGPRQIRAIILAYMEGAPIGKFLQKGKDFTVAERNDALDLILDAAEARIKGTARVVSEMSESAGKFRGGLFVLQEAEFMGFREIGEFEMPRKLGDVERFVDIVLRGKSRWVECKDWSEWEKYRDGLAWQFTKDVRLHLYDPAVFKQVRYAFKKPAPASVAEIRAFLRRTLVAELADARSKDVITAKQEQELLAAFDAEQGLVYESALRREHKLLTPDPGSVKTPPVAPVPPPVPDDDEEEEDEE